MKTVVAVALALAAVWMVATRMHAPGAVHGPSAITESAPGTAPPALPGGAVEVPLSLVGGRLVVPVAAPDGSVLRFALTTGSATTVLSGSTAERYAEGPLTLGGLPIPLSDATTLEDSRLGSAEGALDGMIAPDMLRDFDLLVDAPGGRLVLATPGAAVSWDGVSLSDPVRLRVLHGIVIGLDVEVNGRAYPAMLDLGTPVVVVNPTAGRELGVEGEAFDASLRLGPVTRTGLGARVLDLEVFRRWSADASGFVLVGAAIAEGCALSLSWVHRELRMCRP